MFCRSRLPSRSRPRIIVGAFVSLQLNSGVTQQRSHDVDEQRLTELLVAFQENDCVRERLTPVLRALAGASISDAQCARLLQRVLPVIGTRCGERLSAPERHLLAEAHQLAAKYHTVRPRVDRVRIVSPAG